MIRPISHNTRALEHRPLHVAVIDEELPFPATSGKRIRTLGLLLRVAKKHHITYICHRNTDRDEAAAAEEFFAQRGIETVLIDRPKAPSTSSLSPALIARLSMNLLSPLPYSVQSHTSRALRDAIRQHSEQQQVDLWHCEWSPCVQSLPATVAAPRVAVAHNVESLIWQRYFEAEKRLLRRWYIGGQWRKFERFERKVFAEVDRLIAVSAEDARLARERFGAPRVAVIENGVDLDYFSQVDRTERTKQILFLGSLDWRPNQDAVRQLIDGVFPRIRARCPEATCCIVGRTPPAWLTQLVEQSPGIRLCSNVPDVRPYMSASALMIVPLRIGGGTRLKILEAAAAGLPVVSTAVGAEGLEMTSGVDYLSADSLDDQADACCQLLSDADMANELASSALQVVRRTYGWDHLASKLDACWRDTVTSRSVIA